MSNETLQFPCDIAEEIGLNAKTINAYKKHGCRFIGRKTCVSWVREFLTSGKASSPLNGQGVRRQRSGASKSSERAD